MANKNNPGGGMKRKVKEFFKSQLHTVFAQGQRFGLDILPRHFYSEIPDLRLLRGTDSWRKPCSLTGVLGASAAEQLVWLQAVVTPEAQSRLKLEDVHQLACQDNGEAGYGLVEAEMLHCFILKYKPKTIFQIGCGVSTAICLRAAAQAAYRPRIICVEPYPTSFLQSAVAKNEIELLQQKVQDIDMERLMELAAGDLFFVDSSHTLGPAGEVTRIVLEFMPRLQPGVYAHFHDIYLPYDYPDNILDEALFFSHETPLLLAFLAFNPNFRVLCSLAMMHHQRQIQCVQLFKRYTPAPFQAGVRIGRGHFPTSIYLQRDANLNS